MDDLSGKLLRLFVLVVLAAFGVDSLAACVSGDIQGVPEKKETLQSPGVLSLDAPAPAPADGATPVRLVAVVDSALARADRSTTFRTSAGTFPGGTRELVVASDSNRVAVAVLTAPVDTTTAVVTATAGGGTRRAEVRFFVALPDNIDVIADQVSVQSGFTGSVQVTAALRRSPGTPTAGQVVTFDSHALGETLRRGRFSSDTGLSDVAGRVAVKFTPADSVFTGPIVIVSVAAGRNGPVRDSTIVQVVSPTR